MSRWSDFYREKAFNPNSVQKFEIKYSPFIYHILSISRQYYNSKLIEFGCGTGIVSRQIAKLSHPNSHVLLDNDLEMLKISAILGVGLTNFEYLEHNILNAVCYTKHFEVAHSHGVLEHFPDFQICQIVNNMRSCAKHVICYVPGAKYGKPCTDERLMTPKQWQKICNPTEIIEFNEGYDLILKWEN